MSTTTTTTSSVKIFSSVQMDSIEYDEATKIVKVPAEEKKKDDLDNFNHPRLRQRLVLTTLKEKLQQDTTTTAVFETPPVLKSDLSFYKTVQSTELLDFLEHAWDRWITLGKDNGQDPLGYMAGSADAATAGCQQLNLPFIAPCVPLPRVSTTPRQRPSQHVLGQMGYFCTDTCTPMFADLANELAHDAAVVEAAVVEAIQSSSSTQIQTTIACLPTHPGHHAALDSFGGYCYTNHVAAMARGLQQNSAATIKKVAILDVDYHAGNGTASIFYDDPTVMVVSLHCHPDYDYPFHSGFADETGTGEAQGTTLHLPLMPQTTWHNNYQPNLQLALDKIFNKFEPHALIVSLGLDTYDQDPCALRRAGFRLQGTDYIEMGTMIGKAAAATPVLFLQEGGYRMDTIGDAASNVILSCHAARVVAKKQEQNP